MMGMPVLLHSQYTAQAKAAIQHCKTSVRWRGLNTGGGWLRHPSEVQEKFAARIYSAVLGNYRSFQHEGPFDRRGYIREIARLGRDTQTGNCSELSGIAFEYLEKNNVLPIDYFGVYRGGWNHAFVVLNRDASIPVADFAKWSYNAVVCDPLYDRAADAGHLATWYPRMFPLQKKDVWYRLEEG